MPSIVKSTRAYCRAGPLLPFEELVNEVSMVDSSKQEADCEKNVSEDCTLPDPWALLHVTSRRKAPPRKRSLQMRTMSNIKIDYLTRKLAEAELYVDGKYKDSTAQSTIDISLPDENKSLRELDAIIVIKQLQEKIDVLEKEKSSRQQNLDSVVELVTSQILPAREKFEKLYEELLVTREEATVACEQLALVQSSTDESDCLMKLSKEAQEIGLEVENSRHLIGSISSVVDEIFQCFSAMPKLIVELSTEREMQTSDFLSQIRILQGEILSLSSCSLAKEKESLRKDLEKTKAKLKDIEFKLKNAV
ncbi:kinesin KIN-7O [Olea europaea subsp. europaea]|uniref:Kinesin KIN-7O n=1 Tax=Olea europaea subsp. europaea TaxID=158383 RepID=A0A8S0R2I0_OLEEU|nr:kinesin KIN-7O [Olea europaea subsp. europaea]